METQLEIPQEIVLLLFAVFGFLVTNGLKALFPAWDITGAAAKITAAIVTCIIALANMALALVPPEYKPVAVSIFTLVISVLGAYGIHYSMKAMKKTPAQVGDGK